MKASELLRGNPQVKRVPLPIAGTIPALRLHGKTPEQKEADLEAWRAEHPGQPDPVPQPEVGLLALEPLQSGVILERAREFAKARGLEDPKPDDELYEYGKAIWTCLLGVVDPDSDPAKPEPFFDKGIEQLLSLRELGVDGIQVLAKEHDAFQMEVSGQLNELTEDEYRVMLEEATGPHGFPFLCSLRHGALLNFALTTANQLAICLKLKSGGGLDSAETSRSGQRSREAEREPNRSAIRTKRSKGRRR
jgi:hypothetical protein